MADSQIIKSETWPQEDNSRRKNFIDELDVGEFMIRCIDTIKVSQRVYSYAYRTGKKFKIRQREDEFGRPNGILITRVE
jgi:hypothetical protein